MSLSSKSSSSDSISSGPEDDADKDSSNSKSLQDADVDTQSEDVESEGSINGSSEDEEESANEGAKINGQKRKRQEAEEGSTEEEKVLSHADKRRQKKREEQKLKAQPARAKKSKKSLGVDASSNTKRQNSVWVGNLSYKTTLDDLKAFFAEAGEVARVNMPTKVLPGAPRKPENRGCASPLLFTPQPTRPTFHALDSPMSISRPQKPKLGRSPCLSSTSSAASYS
jgi:RNA recognition motif-containing protein